MFVKHLHYITEHREKADEEIHNSAFSARFPQSGVTHCLLAEEG